MDAADRTRLAKLLGMIGSAHDGEALNAARLAQRLLGSLNITWEELLNGASGPSRFSQEELQEVFQAGFAKGRDEGMREGFENGRGWAAPVAKKLTWVGFARDLRDNYEDDLSDWEQGFVESYVEKGWPSPTPKQRAVFERIADKLGLQLP